MHHSSAKVDKETYLQMCEAMGTEPNDEDMPIDYGELYYECRVALEAYNLLPSSWTSSGDYLGKDMTGLGLVFDLLTIHSNRKEIMQLLQIIDSEVSADIQRQQKAATKKR